jgi:hypothetical protein
MPIKPFRSLKEREKHCRKLTLRRQRKSFLFIFFFLSLYPVRSNIKMAEKPEDLTNSAEKIAKAKELFSRGTRNYYVKSYSEAADDLSEACKLFGEEYGVDGDELGEVYLLYAKSLIAVGQDENKLIEVPEDDDEDEDEPMEEEDGEGKLCDDLKYSLITNVPRNR